MPRLHSVPISRSPRRDTEVVGDWGYLDMMPGAVWEREEPDSMRAGVQGTCSSPRYHLGMATPETCRGSICLQGSFTVLKFLWKELLEVVYNRATSLDSSELSHCGSAVGTVTGSESTWCFYTALPCLALSLQWRDFPLGMLTAVSMAHSVSPSQWSDSMPV